MSQTDFSKVVLTREEERVLEKFKHKKIVELTKNEIDILSNTNLIENPFKNLSEFLGDTIPDTALCELSEHGEKYLKSCKNLRNKQLIEWIRYAITTSIAIAALLVAVLK